MFSTLRNRQIAVIQPSKPILDTWTEDCKRGIPALKSACQSLWQTLIPNLGQTPDRETLEPFLALLKPFMKLSSAEGRDRLNALDIGTELGLLSTILTGKAPTERDNHSLLRRCIDGFFEFNTNFLDIPWSNDDTTQRAQRKLSAISVREESFDAQENLVHVDMSLLKKINTGFDAVDPLQHRTQYLVAGSSEESEVLKAFQTVKNEFYVWAATYTEKTKQPRDTIADKIILKLSEAIDGMREDLKQCETAQKNTCLEAAARLLMDQTDNALITTISLSLLTMIEVNVKAFLAKKVSNSTAARDQHTVCFAMNIVREEMALTLVEDKYPIQFGGVKALITNNKAELIMAAKEALTFGHLADLVSTQLNIATLSQTMVDDEGLNPEFGLDVYNSAPENHQLKNDGALFQALTHLFSPITEFPPLHASEVCAFVAQQEFNSAQALMSAPAWYRDAGIIKHQDPTERLLSLITENGIDIRTFSVANNSVWLLPKIAEEHLSQDFLIRIIQQKKPQIMEWFATDRRDLFVALCTDNPSVFLSAIESGDSAIFNLVKTVLMAAEISFREVFTTPSPLHVAIDSGNSDIFETLVTECNFDIRTTNSVGENVFTAAAVKKNTGIIRILRRLFGDSIVKSNYHALFSMCYSKNIAMVQAMIEPLQNSGVSVLMVLTQYKDLLTTPIPQTRELILDALTDVIRRDTTQAVDRFIDACACHFSPNRSSEDASVYRKLYGKLLLINKPKQIDDLMISHLNTILNECSQNSTAAIIESCAFIKEWGYTPALRDVFSFMSNLILETKSLENCATAIPDDWFQNSEEKSNAIQAVYDTFFSTFANAGDAYELYKDQIQREFESTLLLPTKIPLRHSIIPMFQGALLSQLIKNPLLIPKLGLDTEAMIDAVIQKVFEIQPRSTCIHALTAKEICEFLKKISPLVSKNHVLAIATHFLASGKESRRAVLGYFESLLRKTSHLIDGDAMMAIGHMLITYQAQYSKLELSLIPVFQQILHSAGAQEGLSLAKFTTLRPFIHTIFENGSTKRKGVDLRLRYEGLASLYRHATEMPMTAVNEDVGRCLESSDLDRFEWLTTIVERVGHKDPILERIYRHVITIDITKNEAKNRLDNIPISLSRQLLAWVHRGTKYIGSLNGHTALGGAYTSRFREIEDTENMRAEMDTFIKDNINTAIDLFSFLIKHEAGKHQDLLKSYIPHRRDSLKGISDLAIRNHALQVFYAAMLPLLDTTRDGHSLVIQEVRIQCAQTFDEFNSIATVLSEKGTQINPVFKRHIFLTLAEELKDPLAIAMMSRLLQIETVFEPLLLGAPEQSASQQISEILRSTRVSEEKLIRTVSLLSTLSLTGSEQTDHTLRHAFETEISQTDNMSYADKNLILSWIPTPDTQEGCLALLSEAGVSEQALLGRLSAVARTYIGSGTERLLNLAKQKTNTLQVGAIALDAKISRWVSYFKMHDPETLNLMIQEHRHEPAHYKTIQAMYIALGEQQKTNSPIAPQRISTLMNDQEAAIIGTDYSEKEKIRLLSLVYSLSPETMALPKSMTPARLNKLQRQSGHAQSLFLAIHIAMKNSYPWLQEVSINLIISRFQPFFNNTPGNKRQFQKYIAQLYAFSNIKHTETRIFNDTSTHASILLGGLLTPGYLITKAASLQSWIAQNHPAPLPAETSFQTHSRSIPSLCHTIALIENPDKLGLMLEAPLVTEQDGIQRAALYEAVTIIDHHFGRFFSGGRSFRSLITAESERLSTLESHFKDPLLAIFKKNFQAYLPTDITRSDTDDRPLKRLKPT